MIIKLVNIIDETICEWDMMNLLEFDISIAIPRIDLIIFLL